jgi:hypothetical protein
MRGTERKTKTPLFYSNQPTESALAFGCEYSYAFLYTCEQKHLLNAFFAFGCKYSKKETTEGGLKWNGL